MDTTSSARGLEDQLCFALHAASRAMTAAYRAGLAKLGLTYSQYLVLLILWESGPATVSELCGRLHSDSGTMSPLVARLVQSGFVVRSRGSVDTRTVLVACTESGKALQQQVGRVQHDVAQATDLSPNEAASLRDQLHHLAGVLRGRESTASRGRAPAPIRHV